VKKISDNIRIINAAHAARTIAVIDVLGDIGHNWWTDGGFTKEAVLNDFKSREIQEVHFNISSLGGDYGEALAIKNMAVRTGAKVKVHYFGMVASAATEIGNAATREDTTASSDFFLLIHNTSTWAGGNKEAILKTCESLAKFDSGLAAGYALKSGKRTAAEFAAKMTEDVWMNAEEALEWGLVGTLTEAQPISAHALTEIKASMLKLKIKAPDAGRENDFLNPNNNDMTEKTAAKLLDKFIGLFENAGLKITAREKSVDEDALAHDITAKFKAAAARILAEEGSGAQPAADYTATCTEPVQSIELADGAALALAHAPYACDAAGAAALQADLQGVLNATSVTVAYDEAAGELSIETMACVQALATINNRVAFATGSDSDEVSDLEQQLVTAGKKLAAMNNAATTNKVRELKAELQKINNSINAIAAGKSGGKSLGNRPAAALSEAEPDEENGAGFLGDVIKNYKTNS
jgi:ATP-dependent Clp protease protease subunit